MKRFILFRHGETEFNLEKRVQGSLDIPLNDNGREQAKLLTPVLQKYGVEVIYSSPQRRAWETAEIAAEPLGLEVRPDKRLAEAAFGCIEGMTWEDVQETYPDKCRDYFLPNVKLDDRFPGGESKRETVERMREALSECGSASETVIGISSHGATICRFLQQLGFGEEPMPNGAVFIVDHINGQFIWLKD